MTQTGMKQRNREINFKARADPDMDWMKEGRCLDIANTTFDRLTIMFPSKDVDVPAAKRVCQECPVKQACLSFAILNGFEDGVWGGLDGDERYRNRRNILRAARSARLRDTGLRSQA